MSERTSPGVMLNFEEARKEAARLDRHPAVISAMEATQDILSNTFGIGTEQFDIRRSVQFVSIEDISKIFYKDLPEIYASYAGFKEKDIGVRVDTLPDIPSAYFKQDGKSRPILFIAMEPFSSYFPPNISSESDKLEASKGARYLFLAISRKLIEQASDGVNLELDDLILNRSTNVFINGIIEIASNPE